MAKDSYGVEHTPTYGPSNGPLTSGTPITIIGPNGDRKQGYSGFDTTY